MTTPRWSRYQEDAAAHFRRLGLPTSTNVTLAGVRSTHDVDVVVRFERAGIDHLWIVECKDTGRPVSKDKALLLRTIVDDVGADRGILLCENGFQRGAYEVAERTNVLVTSLAQLEDASQVELFAADVATFDKRVRLAEKSWRALHGPVKRHASGNGESQMMPVLPRGTWPGDGPIAFAGWIYLFKEQSNRLGSAIFL
jgi:restriction system protein